MNIHKIFEYKYKYYLKIYTIQQRFSNCVVKALVGGSKRQMLYTFIFKPTTIILNPNIDSNYLWES